MTIRFHYFPPLSHTHHSGWKIRDSCLPQLSDRHAEGICNVHYPGKGTEMTHFLSTSLHTAQKSEWSLHRSCITQIWSSIVCQRRQHAKILKCRPCFHSSRFMCMRSHLGQQDILIAKATFDGTKTSRNPPLIGYHYPTQPQKLWHWGELSIAVFSHSG